MKWPVNVYVYCPPDQGGMERCTQSNKLLHQISQILTATISFPLRGCYSVENIAFWTIFSNRYCNILQDISETFHKVCEIFQFSEQN